MSRDRKSTRLNSSHMSISYAVFCLKKKKKQRAQQPSIQKTNGENHSIQCRIPTQPGKLRMMLRASSGVIVFSNSMLKVFFFNDTATTEIYTLSLHDALPI